MTIEWFAVPTSPADAPIGVFDSGFGGLTVARALGDLLPAEEIVYLGDSARAPYGDLPIAVVREYALECLDRLAAEGVKLLVIACNSASAAVLRDARERYDIPVVEVILPAARRAAVITRSGRVGVICTQATATSRAYDDAFAVSRHISVTTAACPRFVEFVEAGITSGAEVERVARDYLAPVAAAGVDTVILGCTHYPLLAGVIGYVLGPDVTLVSSADECARAAYATLSARGLLRAAQGDGDSPSARRRFLTTGAPAAFSGIGRRLMGEEWAMAEVEQFV